MNQNRLYIWDNKGFVEKVTATTNGDLLVVNAARCSFDKEHTQFKDKKDTRLINFLAREKHLLPFRHPQLTLRIYCPIFVLRQISKSQVGFSWSEVSRRYISTEPEFYIPGTVRRYAEDKKQGSSEEPFEFEDNILLNQNFAVQNQSCLYQYNRLLEQGVAPEQARMVLPQSMYTTVVVTGSMLGWFHLYNQRTDSHTQLETQYYAKLIGEVCAEAFPVSWNALITHSN